MDHGTGDVIEYTAFGDEVRRVTVEGTDPDIKNGRPGFWGTTDQGEPVWGYDYQIIRVITRAAVQ
jgi:hypothetical protein